ncbi:MAG: hypothetical protein RBT64_03850 [Trichloromonas sp.]|jgi:hypothetical protein|nr:hypothetical protein [Trichloromonas sp.]
MAENDSKTPFPDRISLCLLLQAGKMEELDRRSTRPAAVCAKCGLKTNDIGDLCQGRPWHKR